MRLVIAAPANGAILKDALKAHLQNDPRVSSLVDLSSPEGTYPQLSFAAAEEVAAGRADRALLICGTGVGTAIAANKVRGIRAATAHDLLTLHGSSENIWSNMYLFSALVCFNFTDFRCIAAVCVVTQVQPDIDQCPSSRSGNHVLPHT